jgi:hypothetical protein
VCKFCSTLLDTCAKGRSSHTKLFLTELFTGDETWCFAYVPET